MVPYGYRQERGEQVEDPDEMGVIRLLLSMRKEGHGAKAILREINRQGHKNRAGSPFGIDSIKNLIYRWDP